MRTVNLLHPEVPEADRKRLLPVRWWFHCYVNGGKPQWSFKEWQEYLLEPDYPMKLRSLLTNERFVRQVLDIFEANGVKSLDDLHPFLAKCDAEYPGLMDVREVDD